MGMVKVPKGKSFIKPNDKMNELYLIVQGKVRQIQGKDSYLIENNNLVGLSECLEGIFQSEYVAEEECILYPFAYEKPQDFVQIFKEQPKYAVAFLQAALRQTQELLEQYDRREKKAEQYYAFMMEAYRNYCKLCREHGIPEQIPYHLEELKKPQTKQQLGEWDIAYFKELAVMPAPMLEQFFGKKHVLAVAELVHAARTMQKAMRLMTELTEYLENSCEVLLRERGNDLLELYQELAVAVAQQGQEISEILNKAGQIRHYISTCGMYPEELVADRFAEFEENDFEAIRQNSLEETEEEDEESEDCLL